MFVQSSGRLGRLLLLLTLVTVLSPACVRSGELRPESAILEVPQQPGLLLKIELGHTALRIEDPVYDPATGALTLQLRNVGDRRAMAWEVEVLKSAGEGLPTGMSRVGEDHALAWAAGGGVAPGETRPMTLKPGFSFQEPYSMVGTYTVRIALVVFDDNSYLGDAGVAASVFLDRGRVLREQMNSLSPWENLRQQALSGSSLKSGLRELANQMEKRVHSDFDSNPYRLTFPERMEMFIREHRGASEDLLKAVEKTIQQLRRGVRAVTEATPSAYLGLGPLTLPAPVRRAIASCDLIPGGSRSESDSCPSLVEESWNFTCVGGGTTPPSVQISATGDCTYWDCPPIFQTTINRTADLITWKRQARDKFSRENLPGCVANTNLRSVSVNCVCPNGDGDESPTPGNDGDDSPIVIDIARNGFDLTGLDDPVVFDINGDGTPEQVTWTSASTEDAFLVLDRDGDGEITSGLELFGNYTAQPPHDSPNGFEALAWFDQPANGGNGDGKISAQDTVFDTLRLWTDRDHDGYSQPSELSRLVDNEISALELNYIETRRTDQHGNQFRWASLVRFTRGSKLAAVDVIFQRVH